MNAQRPSGPPSFRIDMRTIVLPLLTLTTVAFSACTDGRAVAEKQKLIETLQTQLNQAQAELQAAKSEAGRLQSAMDELRKLSEEFTKAAEAESNFEQIAQVFLAQFRRDFASFELGEIAGKLTFAEIPHDLRPHPRHGRICVTVDMRRALSWARKWMDAEDYSVLAKGVDLKKTIWVDGLSIEIH